MYRVTIINDNEETVIHSPYVDGVKLESGVIKKEINKIDSFEMSFYLNNPAHGKLKPFLTLIKVLNTKTGEYEFEGRVLSPVGRMDDSGLHKYSWICEGELGYLHDSQQKHREWRGTPKDLFISLLNYHNSQVEPYKQFEPGIFEVTTSTDNLYVYTSAEKTTFEEIEDKILERVGGELRIRKENGVRYLDVLERVGEDKQTEIRIAKNLKSISQSVDPTEIITRLTPLGTRIESDDLDATDASPPRLTIEEVNNGVPYIDRPDLIAEFGIQGGAIVWDEITLPENLLRAGRDWLDNQKVALYQYEIDAVDLSLIGLDIDNFEVGNSHQVINPVMNIDERLRIVGKTTDINNPQESSLKVGDKFKTLDEYQVDANRSAQKVFELEEIVEIQRKRIYEIRNEVKNVETNLKNVQQVIEKVDLEELPNALDALVQAIKDLNEAIDAIPIYDKATPQSDGLMSKEDKAKLDLITLTQNIDLDDVLQRLQALENEIWP